MGKLIRMPPPSEPDPIPQDRWSNLWSWKSDLTEWTLTLKRTNKRLEASRKAYAREEREILALLARGAKIEGGGRIAACCAAWLFVDEILAILK